MRRYFLQLLVVAFSLSFFACQRTHYTPTSGNGAEYFPLEIGKYIVYNVDSTYWYDFDSTMVPKQCQQRYEVVDTFRDGQNRLSYRINVYTRYKDTSAYQIDNVIYATRTSTGIEYTQRNIKFLKLVFPVENGKNWNGNVYIDSNATNPDLKQYTDDVWQWNYVYSLKGADFDPGNNLYENTVTVNEIDSKTNDPDVDPTVYADRNYSKEIYASGVGLIYREREFWTFQPVVRDPVTGQIIGGGNGARNGYAVIMRAIENN